MTDQGLPVVLLAGVSDKAVERTALTVQWDMPRAVVVSYAVEGDALRRIVSHREGVIDDARTIADAGCYGCAAREDLRPLLEQLASRGRWSSILVRLPAGADPITVARVIGPSAICEADLDPAVRVVAVVAALEGAPLVDDLLGDELLSDRGAAVMRGDERTVGEALVAIVEYADIAVLTEPAADEGASLLARLMRPGSRVLSSCEALDGQRLVRSARDPFEADEWVDPTRVVGPADFPSPGAWSRPFHPDRLLANLEKLGSGPRRSRGQFWLPSRPSQRIVWDGIGGQLSIGRVEGWGAQSPMTRLFVCGIDSGQDELARVFERTLVTDREVADGIDAWVGRVDGLEPWLGPSADT